MKPQFSSIPREIGRVLGDVKRKDKVLPENCIWVKDDLRALLVPWLDVLRKAVHFELPMPDPEKEKENGWRDALIKQKQKGIQLPFPELTIYSRTESMEIFTIWTRHVVNPSPIAVFMPDIEGDYQDHEDAIWGRCFVKYRGLADWEIAPYDLSTCTILMNQYPETQGNAVRFPIGVAEKIQDYTRSQGIPDKEYARQFAFLDTVSLRLCWSLCTALDVGRQAATKTLISLPHQRKGGKQTKKKDKSFYAIHRVVYDPSKLIATPSEPKGGTHASPRWHKRRGYWRHMKKSGKVVWVQACEVGKKSNGMVYKDYEIVGITK